MKTIIKIFLITLSSTTIYFHYIQNISSEIQLTLYEDISTGNFREISTARFNVLNLDFPNLSLTSLPMKGVVARYYFLGGLYDEALALLNKADKDNPYIMYNESLKQDIYFKLGVKDSTVYYAEKAFTGIRQNHKHFIDLARAYNSFDDGKDYYKIDSIFKTVENTDVYQIWAYYFASVLAREDLISEYAKDKARIAIEKFKDFEDPQIKISAKYVLYGKKNIDISLDLEQEAIELYKQQQYREAALKFEEAYSYDPSEYLHLENAATCNFLFGYEDRALPQLKEVIETYKPQTGQSEFLLAQIYFKKQQFNEACDLIRKSSKFNFRDSFKYIGEYCSKIN